MKKLVLVCMSLLAFMNVQAQDDNKEKREERKENLEAMKVAFITKELDLTPEEAEKFWPVYNQREAEMEAIHKEMRQQMKGKKIEEMSDAEVEKMLDTQMTMKQKELDIEKSYNDKFKAVIPVKKVAKLHIAEHKFKAEVMRQWKEKHGGKSGGHGKELHQPQPEPDK